MSLKRRTFLRVSATAGGGLLMGFQLFGCGKRDSTSSGESKPTIPPASTSVVTASAPKASSSTAPSAEQFEMSVWVHIGSDDIVTITVPEAEMGQGVLTAVPMIIAEEMDADWSKVRSEHAGLDLRFGRQSTGGSTSIRSGFQKLREVGAHVRQLLITAAASEWKVPASECTASDSAVRHKLSGRTASYGTLAPAAAKLGHAREADAIAKPALKSPAQFKIIGTPKKRLDTWIKVDGSATYGMDVHIEGMVVASVEHSPIFGGSVQRFDASKAKRVPGVIDVVQIDTGVAVVGEHFWAAKSGRDALDVTWNDNGFGQLSSDSIREDCKRVLAEKAVDVRSEGDVTGALKAAKSTVTATYEVPYLAHAPMEPLNCTARVGDDSCEIWVSTQSPSGVAKAVGEITGLTPDKISIHQSMLGGGFGRRSQTDYVRDAVHLANKLRRPVKVVWTREDDIRLGWYRPYCYNELEGGVDADGMPTAWRHNIASPSILAGFRPLKDNIDGAAVEGASNLPYKIPGLRVRYAYPVLPVSVWWWRSVGSSQNAYVTECFLDELARAGGKDPFALRQALLADKPRHRRVLERVAKMSGWGTPLSEGRARGIAVHESFGSFVAQVAEVSLERGKPRVHKVFCAVDCGMVINPDTVIAQMESGIMYGLSAALYGAITIEGGRTQQSNFHDYPVVRMTEAPVVETAIVDSSEAPGGVGEPGLPPIAPAVCNALLALTGKPIRKLPIVS